MPSQPSEQPRRRSSRRSSSYGTKDRGGGGDYKLNKSRRRRSDWDWDLEYGNQQSSELEPDRRDLYKSRSGPSSATRPAPARRTYSREDSATRTVSDSSSSRWRRKVYHLGMERRASASGVSGSRRNSIPYPSFSKAHSRESVANRDDGVNPRLSPYTPDATDLTQRSTRSESLSLPKASRTRTSWNSAGAPPPSPPLTANGSNMRRAHSGGGMRWEADGPKEEETGNQWSGLEGPSLHDAALRFSASRSSLRDAEEGRGSLNPSRQPSYAGPSPLRQEGLSPGRVGAEKSPLNSSTPTRTSPSRKTGTSRRSGVSQPTDSDATSVLPEKKQNGRPPTLLSHRGVSPPSDPESFPRTPNGHDPQFFTPEDDRKATPVVEVFDTGVSESEPDQNAGASLAANGLSSLPPPPPPPPPPLEVSATGVPKVDYLLHNGGLPRQIPKKFVSAANAQPALQSYQQYMSPPPQTPKFADSQTPFAPYQTLLDDMEKVLARNGSIAVATGYKSVARTLLDRLETVFGRNISSQLCSCVMCKESGSRGADTGVSWGEVLELVSSRRELPSWPPFSPPTSAAGLGLSTLSQKPPMQKLDIDVPDEYRDHYIRQSKKTKQVVDNWLASQPEDHTSPPIEVDDETLTFTMLTYLEPSQRPLFTALVRGLSTVPDTRAPTPAAIEPKSDLMKKVGTALERLYRLPKAPREPECSMYLLKNPSIHNALATLAAISRQEWEILVSGRFEGFLVSGAEHQFTSMGPIGSRGVTPFSRGPTPYRNGAPSSYFPPYSATPLRNGYSSITNTPSKQPASSANTGTNTPSMNANTAMPSPLQVDEETEIAVLAEVEREIFLGMEALEDAFEALHVKAEGVRRALRERGAGLSLQARAMGRRGSEKELDARLGTPFDGLVGTPAPQWGFPAQQQQSVSALGTGGRVGGDRDRLADSDDDGLDDAASLAPDDSASNVGWKDRKHVHHRRRRPRRTPAPVDEVSE